MFSAIREILASSHLTLYLLVLGYFWCNWTLKLTLSLLYRPFRESFTGRVSVVMPVYNEDREVLEQAIRRVLAQSADLITEVIVVTDRREPDLPDWLKTHFGSDPRLRITTGSTPGKRFSLRLGIELAREEIVVSIESDVMIREDSISELIKPFNDARIGGAIGDQEVHLPHRNAWTWLDFICEKVKYTLTYPAQGALKQVSVLSGRTVAYRRSAVTPLLDGLTMEYFLGRHCVSGDDGRLTSLLLEAGWKTGFQSTSVVETLSPQSMRGLLRQRTRWNRNTCRRTLRALFWDRLWVWRRYPLVTWSMLTAWLNPIMVGLTLYLLAASLYNGHFFWFGETAADISLRVGVLFAGLLATRIVRCLPALRDIARRRPGWRWLLFFALPGYLLLLFGVRLRAIATMNKQGWVTRQMATAGGF